MVFVDDAATIFLGLSQLRGIGFKTLRDLGGVDTIASAFVGGGARDFVQRLTHETTDGNVEDRVWQLGKEVAAALRHQDIHLVRFDDRRFPIKFSELDEKLRPLWFFYRGNVELLARNSIAVVGTRSPTLSGEFLARYAVSTIRELDRPVVSGLAKGIDEIAHEWALACGVPNISVLANGLLKTYPARNAALADKIVDAGGLLLSEYLPSESPSAEAFVWRNRLQAALSDCVVAPEWKRTSGTAHTIRFAKRLSRPTINLVPTGRQLAGDHGQADILFEVPREHDSFLDALKGACVSPPAPRIPTVVRETIGTQADLFGAAE